MVKRLFGLLLALGAVQVLLPQVVSAARINFVPSSLSLTEGQSQQVSVTLDEPIICEDIEAPCQVSIAISTNAPERVTINTSPIVIGYNQWFQPFHFTVTAVNDALDNGDVTPTVTRLATSGSEYYSNFAPTFSLNILDNDDPVPQQDQADQPGQTISTATDQSNQTASTNSTLPATGTNQYTLVSFALALCFIGLVILYQKQKPLTQNLPTTQ